MTSHSVPKITSPCPKGWSELRGEGAARYCDQCRKSVHNLSLLTPGERAAVLRDADGEVCVAYEQDARGRFVSRVPAAGRSPFERLRVALAGLAAACVPLAFSSCMTMDKPAPSAPADHKQCREVERDGKTEIMLGGVIVEERPLWKRILWPFG